MMKKIFTKCFIAVALASVVGFVSSCKDYNDEIMAEYRGEDALLWKDISALKDTVTDLRADLQIQITEARDDRNAMKKFLNEKLEEIADKDANQSDSLVLALDSIGWAVDSIGKLDARVLALENRVAAIDSVNGRLDVLESINAGQRLGDIEEVLGALESVIGDSTEIATWASNLKTLHADVDSAKGTHESLTARLASMQSLIDSIKSCPVDCEALKTYAEGLGTKIDSLATVTAKTEKTVSSLTTNVASLLIKVRGLDTRVTNLEDAVAAIEEAYQKADQELATDIAQLRSDLTDLEKRVKANEDAIEAIIERLDEVEEDVADLKDGMKNRISSVLVQGAYSPVVGYFNIPFGMKSNILAAYKGEVIEETNFPFGYIDGAINELISLKSSLGYAGEAVSELGNGYAGKLYLTINPAEVDLDSVDFALVNSQNELAPVALDRVVVSSDVLKFGYTRAGGAALYEASATVTNVNAASLNLNLGDYKNILGDLKNGDINITDIASTLYSSINEIADANAVRASWTDSLGEHTVYSDFAVAAVAVKPLSFTFMENLNVQNVPGLTRVHNFIDKTFDKVLNAIPSFDGFNLTAPEIKKIEIKDFDELGVNTVVTIKDTVPYTFKYSDTFVTKDVEIAKQEIATGDFEVDIEIPADTITSLYGDTIIIPARTIKEIVPGKNITIKGDTIEIEDFVINIEEELNIEIEVEYNMAEIVGDLYGSVTEPIKDVNKMLTDLEDFMGEINLMLDELKKVQDIMTSLTDAMDGIKGQLHTYLDKFNNKFCSVVNSLNDKLQPAMFVKTTGSFGMLSQSKHMPTVIENGAVLVPTTYTAELLAPACKKYVAITAVDGSTANLAAANTGDLNKVLEGDVRAVEFNGQSGKTYELTYAALDYAGNVATVKYYVTVK